MAKETLTMLKLATPVNLNGRIAEFSLTTTRTDKDTGSATDITTTEKLDYLFDETKESLLEIYKLEKRIAQRDKSVFNTEIDQRIAELDGIIAVLNAS